MTQLPFFVEWVGWASGENQLTAFHNHIYNLFRTWSYRWPSSYSSLQKYFQVALSMSAPGHALHNTDDKFHIRNGREGPAAALSERRSWQPNPCCCCSTPGSLCALLVPFSPDTHSRGVWMVLLPLCIPVGRPYSTCHRFGFSHSFL